MSNIFNTIKNKFFPSSKTVLFLVTGIMIPAIVLLSFLPQRSVAVCDSALDFSCPSSADSPNPAETVVSASNGACRPNPTSPPEGYKWKADCSTSGNCAVTTDGKGSPPCPQNNFDRSNVTPDRSNWCYDFDPADGQGKCLQLVRPGCENAGDSGCRSSASSAESSITCADSDANPNDCTVTIFDEDWNGNPDQLGAVVMDASWEGINNCSFPGTESDCHFIGADICVKETINGVDKYKLFTSAGNSGRGDIFPRGSLSQYKTPDEIVSDLRVDWIQKNSTTTFILFIDSYANEASHRYEFNDNDGRNCVDGNGYRLLDNPACRACKGVPIAEKIVRGIDDSPSSPPTCAVSATSSLVTPGNNVSITYSGNTRTSNTKQAHLYVSKADGTALASPIGTLVTNSGKYYYRLDTCDSTNYTSCSGSKNIATSQTGDSTHLPPGNYIAFCNAATETTATQCSGNPFCAFNGAISSTPGGTVDCTGWQSCSGTLNQRGGDNVSFRIDSGSVPPSASPPASPSSLSCTQTGDLDGNGSVNNADFEKWKADFGSDNLDTDCNEDERVDLLDFNIWRDKR